MTIFRRAMFAALLVPTCAVAGEFQNLDAINAVAARAAVGAVRPVDQRLKLAACPEALIADPPMPDAVTVRCTSRGWRVRVLTDSQAPSGAKAPILIRRGDPVSVHFVTPRFSVTTQGIAQSEARIGERVRVRVEQTANPVMGEAMDAGSVRVGPLN